MKIEVTYDALLRALIEAIRDQRDHGKALMSLVSRLVDEAGRQDWFETHWRTDARLKLAEIACGDMPRTWQSAAPVLEVIAEAARWTLKTDEIDGESRATLLAISRLAGVERSTRSTERKARPAAKSVRVRKTGQARNRRTTRPAKPAEAPQRTVDTQAKAVAQRAITSTRKPAEPVRARKASGAPQVGRGRAETRIAKVVPPASAAVGAKAKPAAQPITRSTRKPAEPVRAQKASGAAQVRRGRPKTRIAKVATPAPSAVGAKVKPVAQPVTRSTRKPAAKPVRASKASRAGDRVTAQPAKVAAAAPQPAPVTKAQPTVKSPPASSANGSAQANQSVQGPASAT